MVHTLVDEVLPCVAAGLGYYACTSLLHLSEPLYDGPGPSRVVPGVGYAI